MRIFFCYDNFSNYIYKGFNPECFTEDYAKCKLSVDNKMKATFTISMLLILVLLYKTYKYSQDEIH